VGFTLPVDKPSLIEYKLQKRYNKWEFNYDPAEEQAQQLSGLAGGGTPPAAGTGTGTGIGTGNGTGTGFGGGTGTGFGGTPSPTPPTNPNPIAPTDPTAPQQ
jgi:hypothetical protein